ncbi:MAG: hypothetical protein ACXVEI_04930 [Actinomycetota bacterium]
MDVTPYLEAVRADLENVAGSDEATLAVADRLARALEPSLQLRLLDALGQAAQEVSDQLQTGRIEVRLSGRDVHLVFAGEEPAVPIPAEDDSGTARLTLRMPEGLKARVEQQAGREGASTNAWLVRAITRALDQPPRRAGNRLTGFAQT